MRLPFRSILYTAATALCYLSANADLDAGRLCFFPLNETAGTTAFDLSGIPATYHESSGAGEPAWAAADPGVQLLYASQQFFQTANAVANGPTNALTLAATVTPLSLPEWNAILTKGTATAPFALLLNHPSGTDYARIAFIVNFGSPTGAVGVGEVYASTPLFLGNTYHVAVTYDGATIRFYVNGTLDAYAPAATLTFGSVDEPLYIGRDSPGATEYADAHIANVAVYDRALSSAEINALRNAGNLPTSFAGLWIGSAQLNEVREIASDAFSPAPAPLVQRILLHVDANGTPRLLPEATLMQTRVTAPATPTPVVISDSLKIANFDGITWRGGTRVGQRFSSATTPMVGTAAQLSGIGSTLSASLSLPAAHPLNPFRHKYHPDLQNGFALNRTLSINFDPEADPADNAFSATLTEAIDGLHKSTLQARGPVSFTRVSTATTLNP